MKRITAIALLVAASFLPAVSAVAQQNGAEATIPFSFIVGTRTLPAGDYTLRQGTTPTVVTIQNKNQRNSTGVMASGLSGQVKSDGTNKLIFHKYGSQYFLSEIRTSDSTMNLHFEVSKAESRARSQAKEAQAPVDESLQIALTHN
jgi:hypothetical protein